MPSSTNGTPCLLDEFLSLAFTQLVPGLASGPPYLHSMNNYEKSLFIKQEFKEDMKDENSLSDYLKKPSQRLNEYISHLQVRESKQFSCNGRT